VSRLAEWLYEAGIGEARAALVSGESIIAAHIETDDTALRVDSVVSARLIEKQPGRGIMRTLDGAHEMLIAPLPSELEIGRATTVIVTREAIAEPGAVKRAKVRHAPDQDEAAGPDLLTRLIATGVPVRDVALHGPDLLEQAGWSEVLEQAASGEVAFAGGALRISLTPAMTLIDVDGDLAPLPLALAGARAAAQAIVRFDITGSIGIDLPTVGGKADRLAIAAAVDAVLPQPFERTAVNGFGFLQIVRPRLRASLCERLRFDGNAAYARALLRRAQRSARIGALTLVAPPAIIAILEARSDWIAALAAQMGGNVNLRSDPALAKSAAYVAP